MTPIARRLGLLAAGLLLAAPLSRPAGADPTPAAPPAAFSAAQRAEIVRIVRDALQSDPSILGDAIVALRASAEQKQAADADAAIKANQAALAGQTGDTILGNPNGNVTLVEFYDPRCPYCRKVLPDIDTLLEGDHQIRLVEKLIPILGPNSMLDAQAIQAAALQGRYAALQRALMEDNGPPGLDRIKAVAARAGLDVPKLARDMAAPAVMEILNRNLALAHALHLTGTPTFVAGTQMIPGAADLGDLKQIVAAARKPG